MNTKFEEFKELTNYDMIDTYYDDIKDFKYFISNLQEDRVESQKYIVRANKEIERLNNIINELEEYHIKSMKNLENTEDFKYVGINHIKILYEEHKRTLDKLKELKESEK